MLVKLNCRICPNVTPAMVCRNKMTHASRYSLFENNDDHLSETDRRGYLDEGRLYLAKQAREKALYTEALKQLTCLHTAEASFQTALVYFTVTVADLEFHYCGCCLRLNCSLVSFMYLYTFLSYHMYCVLNE